MSDIPPKKSPKHKDHLKELAIKLGVVQREARDLKIPALVVIEGHDASYKGQLLTQMVLEIDSRAYKIHSTHTEDPLAKKHSLLWQYWNNTPAKGMIQFYDRSAYYLVSEAHADKTIKKSERNHYLEQIGQFEQQLSDDGVEIIKVFLKISKREQTKRLEKLESNPKTSWRVTPKDWKRNQDYKIRLEAIDDMIEHSNHACAPWTEIDATDFKSASIELYETVISRLEIAVAKARVKAQEPKASREWIPYQRTSHISQSKDLGPMDRSDYKTVLKELQAEIRDLSHDIHYHKIPVILIYCGWDAAGKGGCIKRLLHGMDPRGYEVVPIGAPTKIELNHHYLWRFWKELPHKGKMTIFDRSWYGRVLVERTEALCSNEEWQRAYQEISDTEKHLADSGTAILKFWLDIDKDVQLERFEARQNNLHKQWKITDEDWRNREKWEHYVEAVNEMIDRTNTSYAPWVIVDANCKMRARLQTLRSIIETLRETIENYRKPAL